MRAINLRAIISSIRSSNGISRGEIQSLTRLSHGAVSQMISELSDEGWILEIECDGPKRKGRRKRLITVNPDKASVIAVQVDSSGVSGSVFDIAASRAQHARSVLPARAHRDAIVSGILSIIHELIPLAPSEVLGIGVAVPGSVDLLTGVARSASRIAGWKEVGLRAEIERSTGVPAFIDNDVRLLAKGHQLEKLIQPSDVALSVWVGEGIGAGISIKGEVFTGAHGLAGELGHLNVEDEGLLCTCGNRGCLETIASTRAILERMSTALSRGVSSQISTGPGGKITLAQIAEALASGDKLAHTVCHEAAREVARALAQAINLISPSKILLSGPLMVFGDPFVENIKHHLRLYTHWEIMRDLELQSTGPGSDYILKGAAALAIDHVWSGIEERL